MMQTKRVQTRHANLHVVYAGPENGPLVILLHGFPEFWYAWRKQIDALAAQGYRVLAPDQRGYNLSDKPAQVAAYGLDALAGDVLDLIKAEGREKASLVGHDWGAAVAWWTANKHPEHVEKLCILNVPHHAVMKRNLKSNPRQLARSWYMFFFQLPKVPELGMRALDFRMAENALLKSSRPGTFTAEDLSKYKEAWGRPGALRAMINWYRAILRHEPARPPSPRITVPTLMIWGAKDRFLGRELAQPSIELCDHGRLEFIENATHWVQHEEPEKVNELLTGFLGSGPGPLRATRSNA